MERTLVLIKPDAVRRHLAGEILRRIEAKGYDVVALEMRNPSRETLERHYEAHLGKDYFQALIDFMASGPVIALVVEGERVIEGVRSLMGTTDPTTAAPGTIRGDLARHWDTPVLHTLVHGSDSPDTARHEIGVWFPEFR